jgi:hypothetical protein|tara:strand:- start:2529 stop:3359 length:831 start_codon:yes stop_codon:yes gene_type:complete
MNRTEKIIELKRHILSLDAKQTRYKEGQTYSDVVVDGKSLCRGGYARREHKNQHLRIDKLVSSIGDIKNKTFIEFGTNTGYMIFRLKELGASKCVGIDSIPDLLDIANKVKDIEGYTDVDFIEADFITWQYITPSDVPESPSLDDIGTFDYAITFSCINAVENDFQVSEWYERVSNHVPTMFIEFSEYITDTPWEDEFNSLDLETLEPTCWIDHPFGKPDGTPFSEEEYDHAYGLKKDNFFKIKTEGMFDKDKYISSWELLGMTDYNRKLYRLDFK